MFKNFLKNYNATICETTMQAFGDKFFIVKLSANKFIDFSLISDPTLIRNT